MEEMKRVRFILQFDNGLDEWRAVQPTSFSTEFEAEQKFHEIKDDPRDFYYKAQRFRIVKTVQTKTVTQHLP